MKRTTFNLLLAGMAIACSVSVAAPNSDNATTSNYQSISSLGRGFIVWESNRTGSWRIWRIELDGTGLRQISANEPNRDHYCPHISPDGQHVVYLSYPKGLQGYDDYNPSKPAPLHIMSADGSNDRVLVPSARAYGEDRAVMWVNNDTFRYIDGDGYSCEYNITKKSNARIADTTKNGYGWIINTQGTYATTGYPATFSPFSMHTRKVSSGEQLDGCQPYFSADGKWGFWMGGAGGPVNRYELATGKISPVIGRRDPRMPSNRNYIYFPMLSDNGRLFAFGASPGQHDHFTADYDIFVARTDPKSFEILGNPVRYSFDPGCDRFPDVWVVDLALGSYSGEAPYTVQVKAPQGVAAAKWVTGDGTNNTNGSTAVLKHTYRKPGRYLVEMTAAHQTYYGEVVVKPAAAPTLTSVTLRGDRAIQLMFSEPVSIGKAQFVLNGKTTSKNAVLSHDGSGVELSFSQPITKQVSLHVKGVQDRAQQPNTIAPLQTAVQPHVWPLDAKSAVLVWQDAKAGCKLQNNTACDTQAVGKAYADHNYAMAAVGGHFNILGAEQTLLNSLKATNRLTIEAEITSYDVNQTGPARIITFSTDPNLRNFTIGQDKNQLVLRLRTPATGENGSNPELPFAEIQQGKPVHIMICYAPGSLQCYVDGRLSLNSELVQGDLSNWSNQKLLIGDEASGSRSWKGAVRGMAIYNQKFSAQQAARSYESFKALHPAAKAAPVVLSAKLVSQSKMPTLDEIKPYREGLMTSLYELQSVVSGVCKEKQLVVVEWAILGGEELKQERKIGDVYTLQLEPYSANPQLEGLYMSDTLNADPMLPLYYLPLR